MVKIIKKHSQKAFVLTLILLFLASYFSIIPAKAGQLTDRSVLLSDSRPGSRANQTITFTLDGGTEWAATETLTLTYQADFDLGILDNTLPGDYEITANGGPINVVAAGACAAEDAIEITSIVGQVITFTACVGFSGSGAGAVMEIKIGDHTAGGSNQIHNPSVEGTYSVDVAGTFGDTGRMLVAIVEGVDISATIPELLSFAVAGVTNANCNSDFGALTGPDTSATAIAFGSLPSDLAFYHGCQDLTISTNAENGYDVTTQQLTHLKSGSNYITEPAGGTSSMSTTVSDVWIDTNDNGLALSCANKTGTDCVFTHANYRHIACTGSDADCGGSGEETPRAIMTNVGRADAHSSRLQYKLTFSGAQPAGDYTNTVVYVATPTY